MRRAVGVVKHAGAVGAGHVTRWSLASLGGRLHGRDGLNGRDGLPNREALQLRRASGREHRECNGRPTARQPSGRRGARTGNRPFRSGSHECPSGPIRRMGPIAPRDREALQLRRASGREHRECNGRPTARQPSGRRGARTGNRPFRSGSHECPSGPIRRMGPIAPRDREALQLRRASLLAACAKSARRPFPTSGPLRILHRPLQEPPP